MDILSIAGLLLGLVAILLGNQVEGGTLSALVNPAAAVIVVGGTCGAALLQTSGHSLRMALAMSLWVFRPPRQDFEDARKRIANWATIARREGILGLENVADSERNEFARRGLQMLVDGTEPLAIRHALETQIDIQEHREIQGAAFFESMGGYAPTIGIIGAVLGLIQVMMNLADPGQLGHGIAVAFVATIYGVGLANLLLLPISSKLKAIVREKTLFHEMMVEGVVSIADGEHPQAILRKLSGFQL